MADNPVLPNIQFNKDFKIINISELFAKTPKVTPDFSRFSRRSIRS